MSERLIAHLQELSTDGDRIISPPSNPMPVAREIISDLYRYEEHDVLGHYRGDFYRYDGMCWPEAEDRGIRAGVYRWLETAKYYKNTPDGGVELVDWSPNIKKVNDVIDAMRAVVHLDGKSDAPLWIQPHETPAAEIVVMENGLLHVPSRTLMPHQQAFFSHNSLPFSYETNAPPPESWLSFLHQLWPDDQASIDALQEILGYILAGDTSLQKIILIVGPKRSGKGTIGRVITGLLGRHNVAAPTMASLAQNFGLQELIGRPLALISDARLGRKTDTSIVVERLLSISGEDSITIDRKYRDPWTGRLSTRFMILTNEVPSLADASGALASRFVLLLLAKSFFGEENPRLTEELLTESTAIFNWALVGLDRLMARGHFLIPPVSKEAILQMEDLSAPVSAFLRDRCVFGTDFEISTEDLWAAWKSWCADENRHPGTKATFGRDLRATAPNLRRTRPRTEGEGRRHVYVGLRLIDADEQSASYIAESLDVCADRCDPDTPRSYNGQGGPSGHGNSVLKHERTRRSRRVVGPSQPCPSCGQHRWSLRVGGQWLCEICSPALTKVN